MKANCELDSYFPGRKMSSAEDFVPPEADEVCQASPQVVEPSEAPRILILSLAKSGTTILYQILKESLPSDALCLFEPQTCQPEDVAAAKGTSALAKVLIEPHNGHDHYGPQACAFFNKRIFLRRDPRDLLVSVLLYVSYHSPVTSDFWSFAQFQSALRAKERASHSVSMLELLELAGYLSDSCLPPLFHFEQFVERLRISRDVARMHGNGVFHLKYEDVVDRRLGALEEYLGLPLAQVDQVDARFQRVTRTKAYGDWRNWFLKSDVDYFRPRLARFMQVFGYEDDWELSDRPVVSCKNASAYLTRLAEERGHFRGIDFGPDAFPPENSIRVDPSLQCRPHLIPNLRPKATEVYPNRGATIRDPHVETVDGQRVNVLSPGDRYVYKYEVLFTSPARNVSCGMSIVDQEGATMVGNSTSNHSCHFESIDEGRVLRVEFEYVCRLNRGVHFLNAGVTTSEPGAAQVYAHRILAATLIIVRHPPASLAGGAPRVTFLDDADSPVRRELCTGKAVSA